MDLLALGWGIIAGSALFIGAGVGWRADVPPRVIAAFMAFASGLLLSVAAFDLLEEAFVTGGFGAAATGYLIGAAVFAAGLYALDRAGARHRKRARVSPEASRDPAAVVALATIVDSVPETLILGLSFAKGEGLAFATLAAVFLSNVPESLAATTRMKAIGRGPGYVFGVWALVAAASGIAALAGYTLLTDLGPGNRAITQAISGGALLVFMADAMIPEAFGETRDAAGFLVALGFLAGFSLSHVLS